MTSDPIAEAQLIACLLLRPDAVQLVRPILPAHALTVPWMRTCYRCAVTGTPVLDWLVQHTHEHDGRCPVCPDLACPGRVTETEGSWKSLFLLNGRRDPKLLYAPEWRPQWRRRDP